MTPIASLLAAVEAKDRAQSDQYALKAFGLGNGRLAHLAHEGSTDAAISLCEAMLPGWVWGRNEGNMYVKDEIRGLRSIQWGGPNENAARSLLIAVLRALVVKEGEA